MTWWCSWLALSCSSRWSPSTPCWATWCESKSWVRSLVTITPGEMSSTDGNKIIYEKKINFDSHMFTNGFPLAALVSSIFWLWTSWLWELGSWWPNSTLILDRSYGKKKAVLTALLSLRGLVHLCLIFVKKKEKKENLLLLVPQDPCFCEFKKTLRRRLQFVEIAAVDQQVLCPHH